LVFENATGLTITQATKDLLNRRANNQITGKVWKKNAGCRLMKYTVEQLKKQFRLLKDAKAHFNLKASSWVTLVEKLNKPTYEQLQEQIKNLEKLNFDLEQKLKKSADNSEFDEVGFWLLSKNFDRSRFSDFETPEAATRVESVAKGFYKELANKYHPDKGGTNEQMASITLLYDQLIGMVEINEGMGK
jgi:hypothetical protein